MLMPCVSVALNLHDKKALNIDIDVRLPTPMVCCSFLTLKHSDHGKENNIISKDRGALLH